MLFYNDLQLFNISETSIVSYVKSITPYNILL